MTIFDPSIVPEWVEIIEQTDNFALIMIKQGYIELHHAEELLSIGLQFCGVTSASSDEMLLSCIKVR